MKKIIAVVLCLILTLSLFACGKKVEVDYENTPLQDWMYQFQTEDPTTRYLITIDTCQYGTAGASLKQMAATVALAQLCAAADREEKLDAYLAGMTDTQRDFFSFQWQMRLKHATQTMNDPKAAEGTLRDIGFRGELWTSQAILDLDSFTGIVQSKLKKYGVSDQWERHLDKEPFTNWESEQ